MNKNLMAIFHQDFRVGDVVKNEYYKKIIIVKFITDNLCLGWDIKREALVNLSLETIKVRFVPLYEVLEKLIYTEHYFSIDANMSKDLHIIVIKIAKDLVKNEIIRVAWVMSDKDGEVPLHRQTQETQDKIYEVLK